ncbi:MAG: CrcB family protein [Methanomicrobiales archaeon]
MVNVLGCIHMAISMYKSIYIGAFTTFSALAVQRFAVSFSLATTSIGANLVLGLFGIFVGGTSSITSWGSAMEPFFLVGNVGAIGSIFRFESSKLQPVQGLPTGTALVNILGSFDLLLVVFTGLPGDLYSLVGIGAQGGFTTFSTFCFKTFRMLEDNDHSTMLKNMLINIVGSLAVMYAGHLLVLWLV